MTKTTHEADDDDELLTSDLYYNVEDNPPIGVTIFFGFQIAVANICFIILYVVMLTNLICADEEFSSKMFSTVSFMVGVTTIVQTYAGVSAEEILLQIIVKLKNVTAMDTGNMTWVTDEEPVPPWTAEWAKVAGSLMAAQAVQVLLALTGAVALLMRLIRPITVAVIFILLAVWLHGLISSFSKVHWGMSALSIAIVILMSQYINWVKVPIPAWTPRKGLHLVRFPLFELFPVLFAVIICWALSAIITAAGGFPDHPADIRYNARTDISGDAIRNAPVFRFPYPGQFCSIDFRIEYFIIYLVGIVLTVLESMGDYCQYAITCCLPRPPDHVFNRGIFVEGFCGFFSALLGMGHATTSYSNIVGIVRVTRVASRRVYATGAVMLIVLGLFGKAGALFVSIPKSVLAGPVFIGIALLLGATFMNLKNVDLGKTRNQTILGCSIIFGVFVPFYFGDNRGDIDTGSTIADQIIISIITIPFLVGGIAAVFLDNTLPGRFPKVKHVDSLEADDAEKASPKENLLQQNNGQMDQKREELRRRKERLLRVYDPPFISKYTRRWNWTRYVPILPNPYPRGYDADERANGMTQSNKSLSETNV